MERSPARPKGGTTVKEENGGRKKGAKKEELAEKKRKKGEDRGKQNRSKRQRAVGVTQEGEGAWRERMERAIAGLQREVAVLRTQNRPQRVVASEGSGLSRFGGSVTISNPVHRYYGWRYGCDFTRKGMGAEVFHGVLRCVWVKEKDPRRAHFDMHVHRALHNLDTLFTHAQEEIVRGVWDDKGGDLQTLDIVFFMPSLTSRAWTPPLTRQENEVRETEGGKKASNTKLAWKAVVEGLWAELGPYFCSKLQAEGVTPSLGGEGAGTEKEPLLLDTPAGTAGKAEHDRRREAADRAEGLRRARESCDSGKMMEDSAIDFYVDNLRLALHPQEEEENQKFYLYSSMAFHNFLDKVSAFRHFASI